MQFGNLIILAGEPTVLGALRQLSYINDYVKKYTYCTFELFCTLCSYICTNKLILTATNIFLGKKQPRKALDLATIEPAFALNGELYPQCRMGFTTRSKVC